MRDDLDDGIVQGILVGSALPKLLVGNDEWRCHMY